MASFIPYFGTAGPSMPGAARQPAQGAGASRATAATRKTKSHLCSASVCNGFITGMRDGKKQGPYVVAEIARRAMASKGACIEGMMARSWGTAALEACYPHFGQPRHETRGASKHAWEYGSLSECKSNGGGEQSGADLSAKRGSKRDRVADEKHNYNAAKLAKANAATNAASNRLDEEDDGWDSGGTQPSG